MMWKKRPLVALALGGAAALLLASCAGTTSGGGSTGAKSYKLAYVEGVTGDDYYLTLQCGIEAEAKKLGATVTTQGPEKYDPTLQKPIVDSVVATHPDALLVAPTDTSAMQAPLEAASAAGVKVVLVDTTVKDPSFAASQIASDNVAGGAAAFAAIKKAHPDGGKVLVVAVDPGVSASDARSAGFKNAAEADSKFQFLGIQYSHNQPTTAAQIVTAALQKDPDIVGIFAVNLFAAEGTATGVQQAGQTGKLTVVGFDAGPDQVKQLQAGAVEALIAQDPYKIGQLGVQQAIASLKGEKVTKKIQTGFTVITKDNLDSAGAKAVYKTSCS